MPKKCQRYDKDMTKIYQRYATIPTVLILWINLREHSRIDKGKRGFGGEWGGGRYCIWIHYHDLRF